jgi:hypothetical protein
LTLSAQHDGTIYHDESSVTNQTGKMTKSKGKRKTGPNSGRKTVRNKRKRKIKITKTTITCDEAVRKQTISNEESESEEEFHELDDAEKLKVLEKNIKLK